MSNTSLYIKKLVDLGRWKDVRSTIWGDSFNWSWIRPWNQLEGIVIHHSATKHEATAEDVALMHKARGWAGIGYHFIIEKNGLVKYVGDISTARAHVANKNEKYLGVCLIGDFTKHLPSDAQIESAHDLCSFFWNDAPSLPTLKGWHQLSGHKDHNPTACPGTSFPDDMRKRIIDRRIYTVVEPPIPTPPPVDWKAKYEDEVKAHGKTKEEFENFKEESAITVSKAVIAETERCILLVRKLAESL